MERFKKRTIALVLASVVTVVGAFGADAFKNSLTGISFDGSSSDGVNLVVKTKNAVDGEISPMRKDAYTYVVTLPETDSIAPTPNLRNVSSSIASVNVRTMPYSNTAKGYTRITIKTVNPSMNLTATNIVGISSEYSEQRKLEQRAREEELERIRQQEQEQKAVARRAAAKMAQERTVQVVEETPADSGTVEIAQEKIADTGMEEIPVAPEPSNNNRPSASSDNTYLWLWALLIVLGSVYFVVKAKNKMQEIAGESLNIDVNDEKTSKSNKKIDKIKKTINKLDSAYSKTSVVPNKSEYTVLPSVPVKSAKPVEELDIVDLDALFQEHKAKTTTKEEEENAALEEFLSGFSFDDTEEQPEEEISAGYDEEFYEKTINNSEISFSKEDLSCIGKLLESEINDDTMRNIEKYAVSCPIQRVPSKKEILEELITNYTISQNILFTKEDVEALYKIINVELDQDFITDLRTNPEKAQEMAQDILAYGDKPKKPSEIITLSVKDMLPDLSDALKKQGNKKIESNRKAETIYFSEGYEVSKLVLSDALPDLSKEINKKDAYASKPSAVYDYVDTSYVVGNSELKISSELPDLQDVLAHPEKYEKPEEPEVVVDADALLKNISNVQFKPFYDGTNEFEVLNDFSDAPSVSDIQNELNQFDGFEVAEEEHIEAFAVNEEYDDFKALYSNDYVDLDKEEAIPENIVSSADSQKSIRSQSAEELMKKIEATKLERERRRARIVQKEEIVKIEDSIKQEPAATETVKCILDGSSYTVISSAAFDEEKGCHLAKNEKGFAVLGYVGSRVVLIKNYETLKSEKIHTRLSEQLPDGTSRYIVRIGIQKLIVQIKDNKIEYVMDLC